MLIVAPLNDPDKIAHARLELARLGYIATLAPRMLDALAPGAVLPPAETATPP